MTRHELIQELKACERRIAALNDDYRWRGGLRPSVADPDVCRRRNELRRKLIEREYDTDDTDSTGKEGS